MDNGRGQLSELERVKLENFALKNNLMQQQLQLNLSERAVFIRQLEAAHPGYRWTDQNGLVPDGKPVSGNGRSSAGVPDTDPSVDTP